MTSQVQDNRGMSGLGQMDFLNERKNTTSNAHKKNLLISAIAIATLGLLVTAAAVSLSVPTIFFIIPISIVVVAVVVSLAMGVSLVTNAKLNNNFRTDLDKTTSVQIDGVTYSTYEKLPGLWQFSTTSQTNEGAVNGCTSIAAYISNKILENSNVSIDSQFIDFCIKEGAQKHLDNYGTDPLNRVTNEVVSALNLDYLGNAPTFSVIYSPAMLQANLLPGGPRTRQELTGQMISNSKNNPFVATLTDGLETIALYYKNEHEMYVIDSHVKTFRGKGQINLETAYVVKFSSKAEMDEFLFDYRFFYDKSLDQEGGNQLEAEMFCID